MTTITMQLNNELKGIELFFNTKPATNILSNLKANKFRWSNFKKCWYAKQSENTLNFANSLVNGLENYIETNENNNVQVAPATKVKKVNNKGKFNLWNATQENNLIVNEQDQRKDTKEIAKNLRVYFKSNFSNCKISVTSSYGKISVTIKSSPYEKGSIYLNAILEHCEKVLNSYKYCTSYYPYGDYGSSYNFYSYTSICYDYEQTAVTNELKEDMINFNNKLKEKELQEQLEKEIYYTNLRKEEEQRKQEYKIYEEKKKESIKKLYNSIEVKSLGEKETYFIIESKFANMNKNNNLSDYEEQIENNEFYLQNVKVTKEIHFNNIESLSFFSNSLLTAFDFLQGTGGSYTDDNRINSMSDFYNMNGVERNTVKWINCGVAIYYNNELQFIVDAQGHSYARYVGLTENAKIVYSYEQEQVINENDITELQEKAELIKDISTRVIEKFDLLDSWKTSEVYKKEMKNALKHYDIKLTKEIIQQITIQELKEQLYKLITEIDSLEEQFTNADFKEDEKLTLYYISDWGCIMEQQIKFIDFKKSKYAQYDNAIKLSYKTNKKRGSFYNYFYSDLLVFKGWGKLPEEVLYEITEDDVFVTKSSKFGSCDKEQFKEILNYYSKLNTQPSINSYNNEYITV